MNDIPKDPRTNYCVMIMMHTDDASRTLTYPQRVRELVGVCLDAEGLQEEVDYTLYVYRSEASQDITTRRIRKLESGLDDLQWNPITPDNMPKGYPYDECLHRAGYTGSLGCKYEGLTFEYVSSLGWTHFRPINAPIIKKEDK